MCLATTNCLPLFQLLRANNYLGILSSQLYADTDVPGVAGMLATPQYVPFSEATAAQQQMLADVHAVKADAALTPGVVAGYFAADMLVAALVRLQRDGTSITPKHVQRAAARMTFEVSGPVRAGDVPERVRALVARVRGRSCATPGRRGSRWSAFTCTKKTAPLDPRFAQVY